MQILPNLYPWLFPLVFLMACQMMPAQNNHPLTAHKWQHRILVVVVPDAEDPLLSRQRAAIEAMGDGWAARDLRLYQVMGQYGVDPAGQALAPDAVDGLRAHLGTNNQTRAVYLIGKDGGVKKILLATAATAEMLFPIIDAMPMRQREMRQHTTSGE